jgi:hypothetical protein
MAPRLTREQKKTLALLRQASQDLADAMSERTTLLVKAREEQEIPYSHLVAATGLTRQGIKKMIDRGG